VRWGKHVDAAVRTVAEPGARQLDQPFARDHALGVIAQGDQQVELGAGHLDRGPGRRQQFAARQVDRPTLEAEFAFLAVGRTALDRMAAQHRADPGDQLARAERLGEIIVGAEFEPDDAVGLAALGRDEDDRHVAGAAKLAAQIDAAGPRQHDVEQHEIDRPLFERAPHFGRGRGGPDSVAILLQRAGSERAERRVVLDQDDIGGGHRPASKRFMRPDLILVPSALKHAAPNRQ